MPEAALHFLHTGPPAASAQKNRRVAAGTPFLAAANDEAAFRFAITTRQLSAAWRASLWLGASVLPVFASHHCTAFSKSMGGYAGGDGCREQGTGGSSGAVSDVVAGYPAELRFEFHQAAGGDDARMCQSMSAPCAFVRAFLEGTPK